MSDEPHAGKAAVSQGTEGPAEVSESEATSLDAGPRPTRRAESTSCNGAGIPVFAEPSARNRTAAHTAAHGTGPSVDPALDDGAPPSRGEWLLSQVGSALASSFDYDLTLRRALDMTLPWLGDWAILDLLGESDGVRRAVVSWSPTEDQSIARLLRRRPPVPGDGSDPIVRVLNDGESELIEHVSDPTLWGHGVVDRLAPRSWITVPVRARGRVIGALTFLTARSKRRLGRAHLVLAERLASQIGLAADNARLYDEAARAIEAKSAFLAVMSHELRTPLTAIIGYTELLSDGLFGEVTDQQQLQLGRVRESSEHLLKVVEQVLQYAKLESRQELPEPEAIDACSIVEQAVSAVRPLAERKGIALETGGLRQPIGLRADPERLRQVLVNLLGNAVKFTGAGEVRVNVRERNDRVVFEVRDTGPGIPAGQLGRIFEPFWQADQRFTRPKPGSGLGLSVTRQLVALLGGGIDVSSTVGVGSTFTFWVPRDASCGGGVSGGRDSGMGES